MMPNKPPTTVHRPSQVPHIPSQSATILQYHHTDGPLTAIPHPSSRVPQAAGYYVKPLCIAEYHIRSPMYFIAFAVAGVPCLTIPLLTI